MQVPKVSEGRRWQLGLGVTLLAVALVIVTAALGGTSSKSVGSQEGEGRLRRGVQGEPRRPQEDALRRQAPAAPRYGAQHRTGRVRPCEQEGQLQPRAEVLEERRLQDRDGRQADRRLRRAVRRERLPAHLEDGVHPPGADVQVDRQDHLPVRPFRPEPGSGRLPGDDRAARERDRHLSGLRRRDPAGVQGGEEGPHPGRDLRLGLRRRAWRELHDRRRRERLQDSAGHRPRS